MLRLLALSCLMLLLAACGEPRQPIIGHDQAMGDQRPLDLRVVKVFDAMEVMTPTKGSHLIEVKVLDGAPEYAGKVITLPYDEWSVGRKPPAPGTVLRVAPRDWLVVDPDSKGRPLDGWDGTEEHRKLR